MALPKLSDEQVIEMRQIYQQWVSEGSLNGYETLGKIFGCGASTARDIVKHKTRNNVGKFIPVNDVFCVAETTRQTILDYINKTSSLYKSNREIHEAIGFNYDHIYRTTRKMVELNELKQSGHGLKAKFRPLVDKTISAQILREAARTKHTNKLEERIEENAKKKKNAEPWRTVHIGGKDPVTGEERTPYREQGGQGFHHINSWRRPGGSS